LQLNFIIEVLHLQWGPLGKSSDLARVPAAPEGLALSINAAASLAAADSIKEPIYATGP
jgi:hypothetical protein